MYYYYKTFSFYPLVNVQSSTFTLCSVEVMMITYIILHNEFFYSLYFKYILKLYIFYFYLNAGLLLVIITCKYFCGNAIFTEVKYLSLSFTSAFILLVTYLNVYCGTTLTDSELLQKASEGSALSSRHFCFLHFFTVKNHRITVSVRETNTSLSAFRHT